MLSSGTDILEAVDSAQAHLPAQLQISFLASWYDLNLKEIGTRVGIDQKSVSHYLRRGVKGAVFQRLPKAMNCPPAAVQSGLSRGSGCLGEGRGSFGEEQGMIEEAVLKAAPPDAGDPHRCGPLSAEYPHPSGLFLARRWAEELWGRLKELDTETRLAVVWVVEEYQNWALC